MGSVETRNTQALSSTLQWCSVIKQKHQDIIKRVRGVCAQVCCSLPECHWEGLWMYLSVFLEKLWESVFIPFHVFINVILCVCVRERCSTVCPAQILSRRKMRERKELWGEDVRNPHFLLMEEGGEGGREGGRERKRKRGKKDKR